MTRSYKMLCLRALLNHDALPGSLGLAALTAEFARVAARNARVRDDVSVPLDDLAAVRRLLLKNPIHYWGQSRANAFRLDGDRWVCTVPLDGGLRDAFVPLMDELVEWRLAEYLSRGAAGDFELKVSQTGGCPPMLLSKASRVTWRKYLA